MCLSPSLFECQFVDSCCFCIPFSQLSQINDALRAELLKEKKELKRQLDRKKDFEAQVAELKLELEEIQKERRKVSCVACLCLQ